MIIKAQSLAQNLMNQISSKSETLGVLVWLNGGLLTYKQEALGSIPNTIN
jgi:hypothetical protein